MEHFNRSTLSLGTRSNEDFADIDGVIDDGESEINYYEEASVTSSASFASESVKYKHEVPDVKKFRFRPNESAIKFNVSIVAFVGDMAASNQVVFRYLDKHFATLGIIPLPCYVQSAKLERNRLCLGLKHPTLNGSDSQ